MVIQRPSGPTRASRRHTLERSDRLGVERLSAGYGASVVVRDVSLRIAPGEAVALLGRNGAGKSTTLMAIAGAIRPSSGSVAIDGRPVEGLPSFRIARLGLSLVPQGRRVFPTLSVRENLLLGSRGGRRPRRFGRGHGVVPV